MPTAERNCALANHKGRADLAAHKKTYRKNIIILLWSDFGSILTVQGNYSDQPVFQR